MNEEDFNDEDRIIEVKLPVRDYKALREIIDERKLMEGMSKKVAKALQFVAAVAAALGLVEIGRRVGWW